MKASRMAILLLGGALCTAPAWGAEAARAPAPASGVTAAPMDKCPMHEMREETMHKAGEPCPFDKASGKLHEKCDEHVKKDCLEKNGEPCPYPRDGKRKGKDFCDPSKRGEKSVK